MRDFVAGVRLFGRGWGILLRSRRLLWIGVLPAVLTTVLLLGGVIALAYWIDEVAAGITPFAADWAPAGERRSAMPGSRCSARPWSSA